MTTRTTVALVVTALSGPIRPSTPKSAQRVELRFAAAHDRSTALSHSERRASTTPLPTPRNPRLAPIAEQTTQGSRPALVAVASFDGLGVGFSGPQGSATLRNPSDNSLAVGRDHIVQVVNSRTAIFTKKGAQFDTTGRVLYGPVETRNVFKGFGGPCEARNNGDAVVRYDQLADRWLIVMPIFSRVPRRPDEPVAGKDGDPARPSVRGQPGHPGPARILAQPRVLPADSQSIA